MFPDVDFQVLAELRRIREAIGHGPPVMTDEEADEFRDSGLSNTIDNDTELFERR